MESPVCTPMGSRFSMEQTMMPLPATSRMTSISISFQPIDGLLDQHLAHQGTGPGPARTMRSRLVVVVGNAAAGAAQGEGRGG